MMRVLFAVLLLCWSTTAFADTPDDAVREAVQWLEQGQLGLAPNLRFISLYNVPTDAQRFDPSTKQTIPYSPLDETVRVLIWTVNQLNRTQPVASLARVSDRLFVVDINSVGWQPSAWDKFAQTTTYFSPDWILLDHWNYLVTRTGSQVPIVRADEFIAKSTVGVAYYDFLFGTDQCKTRADLFKVLGVDEKFISDANLVNAGTMSQNPTVTRHNRRLVFQPGPFWVWTSFDTDSNKGDANVHRRLGVVAGTQHELRIAGQEHIFKLRWGGFGGFLNDAKGTRLDEVPNNIAAGEDNFPDRTVKVGRSCMACHDKAVKSFQSDNFKLQKSRLVELATTNPQDADKLESVYDETAIQDHLEDNQREYERALKRLLGVSGEEISREYTSVWNKYSEDRVDIERAAEEMGCTVEDAIQAILPAIDPNLLLLLPQKDEKFTLPRDAWEDSYRTAMLLRGRPQYAPVAAPPDVIPEKPRPPTAKVLSVKKPANGVSVETSVKFSLATPPQVEKYNSDRMDLVKVGGGASVDEGALKSVTYPVTLSAAEDGAFPTWVEFTLKGTSEVIRFEVKP